MRFVTPRPFADPDVAARKLVETANAVEAVQDGRICIERVNAPFLAAGGSGDDFRAGHRAGLALAARERHLCEVSARRVGAMSRKELRNFDCPETEEPCTDGRCIKGHRCCEHERLNAATTREMAAREQRKEDEHWEILRPLVWEFEKKKKQEWDHTRHRNSSPALVSAVIASRRRSALATSSARREKGPP
jgi:hypothetical protein